jgi:ABC-type bacteriocin/lantibiotic exporter with double-glycine peptidase domain
MRRTIAVVLRAPEKQRRRPEAFLQYLSAAAGALAVSALLLMASCATSGLPPFSPPSGSARLDHVPFFAQVDYECGPASLAGVLNYYGRKVTPEQVAAAIFRFNIRGTVTLDMVLYARDQGLSANWYDGSVDDLVRAVNAGVPIIVMVDYGFFRISKNHFMVVVGYDPEGIIANSGASRETLILWKDFLPTWERAKCWTLRIEAKASAKTG